MEVERKQRAEEAQKIRELYGKKVHDTGVRGLMAGIKDKIADATGADFLRSDPGQYTWHYEGGNQPAIVRATTNEEVKKGGLDQPGSFKMFYNKSIYPILKGLELFYIPKGLGSLGKVYKPILRELKRRPIKTQLLQLRQLEQMNFYGVEQITHQEMVMENFIFLR